MPNNVIDLFDVKELNYDDRSSMFTAVSEGNPPSVKKFPVYKDAKGADLLFKPLSRTKPFCTPLFAYAEVWWSYFINKYFDSATPVYKLAKCKHLEDYQPKSYEQGTLVNSYLKEGQEYISLSDYFKSHPEDMPKCMDGYINYCEKNYDYRELFDTKLFSENDSLGRQLAFKVLVSILIRDQNFHYENNGLIYENGQIVSLNPVMDSEFATIFFKADKPLVKWGILDIYDKSLNVESIPKFEEVDSDYLNNPPMEDWVEALSSVSRCSELYGMIVHEQDRQRVSFEEQCFFMRHYFEAEVVMSVQQKNIAFIAGRYPDLCQDFLKCLNSMYDDLENSSVVIRDENYVGTFSSGDWEVGYAKFKEHDVRKAYKIEKNLRRVSGLPEELKQNLLNDTRDSVLALTKVLEYYLRQVPRQHAVLGKKNTD